MIPFSRAFVNCTFIACGWPSRGPSIPLQNKHINTLTTRISSLELESFLANCMVLVDLILVWFGFDSVCFGSVCLGCLVWFGSVLVGLVMVGFVLDGLVLAGLVLVGFGWFGFGCFGLVWFWLVLVGWLVWFWLIWVWFGLV